MLVQVMAPQRASVLVRALVMRMTVLRLLALWLVSKKVQLRVSKRVKLRVSKRVQLRVSKRVQLRVSKRVKLGVSKRVQLWVVLKSVLMQRYEYVQQKLGVHLVPL